jgi:hypothetical protein
MKQSLANRLLDQQRGPAPFPGPRPALRTALTGTARPSLLPGRPGRFYLRPNPGAAAPIPFPARPITMSRLAARRPAGKSASLLAGVIHEQGPAVRRHAMHRLQTM